MKLYFAPGFSSLADHIALIEAGLPVDLVKVDIASKQMTGGGNYFEINPKGYVPALQFDDGELLTENVAILAWIADRAPRLAPGGTLGRYRLIEMLSFIASEIHRRFPIYLFAPDDAKPRLRDAILHWFNFLAPGLERGYLLGESFGAADGYLFVMARGALELGFPLPDALHAYVERIAARASVQRALDRELGTSTAG